MFIAAIKCDFCNKAHEIPCRKSGDKPDIPDGWAVISPTVRVKGTPKGGSLTKFNMETMQQEPDKEAVAAKKLYDERRDKLRAKFDKSHVCIDCIEEILTGNRSVKIEMGQ